MGDFMDFSHKVKKISKRCRGDERVVYTETYTFNYPHSHRVQGGLRVGDGHVTVTLILCSDSDDKHLIWPVKLEVKVLAYKDGNTTLLGRQEMQWTIKNVEEGSEDVSWKNGITVSLGHLQENDVIGPDDSVIFLWSVKLSYPPLPDLQTAQRSSDAALQETDHGKTESGTEENVDEDHKHENYQEGGVTHCSVTDTSMLSKKSDDNESDNDIGDLAEVENIAAEMIRCYSIDTVPYVMNLEIVMDKAKISQFRHNQTRAHKKAKKIAETYGKATAADSKTGEHNILQTKHTHLPTVKSDSSLSTSKGTERSVSMPAWKTIDADLVEMLLETGKKQDAENQQKLTSLMSRCLHGDKENVGYLIFEPHTNINIQGPWGMTALMLASWKGNKQIVELLLEQKADVNKTNNIGMNALMMATIKGHIEIVKLLAATEADVNKIAQLKLFWTEPTLLLKAKSSHDLTKLMSCRLTCLIIAAASGQCSIVEILLNLAADINAETGNGMSALKAACYIGQSETVRLLLKKGGRVAFNEKSLTPVMMASVMDNVDIIEMLLEEGADVNVSTVDGTTSLMVASRFGSCRVVKALVDKKAKAEVDAKDKRGCTSLMFASAGGHLDVVKLLLARNANVDIPNVYQMTPLMYASLNGNAEIIRLLLETGANIEARDNDGMTSFVFACANGHTDAVECLLMKRANFYSLPKGISSPNALVRAASNGHTNIVKILLKWGAPVNVVDKNGMTPLTAASIYGHSKTVEVLIQEKSTMRDRDKLNAILNAHKKGHSEVRQILLDGLQAEESENELQDITPYPMYPSTMTWDFPGSITRLPKGLHVEQYRAEKLSRGHDEALSRHDLTISTSKTFGCPPRWTHTENPVTHYRLKTV